MSNLTIVVVISSKIEASLHPPPDESQPESWASQVESQMSPAEKDPPHSISLESAAKEPVDQDTSPINISASTSAETQEVSDVQVSSSSSKGETELSSTPGDNRTDASTESVEAAKSHDEVPNSKEKASSPDTSAPA